MSSQAECRQKVKSLDHVKHLSKSQNDNGALVIHIRVLGQYCDQLPEAVSTTSILKQLGHKLLELGVCLRCGLVETRDLEKC
jgi:hypothetical protein